MCRAVWVLAVGPDEDACKAIRRAAGADVQVVAMATGPSQAKEMSREVAMDAAVIDERTPDAYGVIRALAGRGIAVVWVGANPPPAAHTSVLDVSDGLQRAIGTALTAMRR